MRTGEPVRDRRPPRCSRQPPSPDTSTSTSAVATSASLESAIATDTSGYRTENVPPKPQQRSLDDRSTNSSPSTACSSLRGASLTRSSRRAWHESWYADAALPGERRQRPLGHQLRPLHDPGRHAARQLLVAVTVEELAPVLLHHRAARAGGHDDRPRGGRQRSHRRARDAAGGGVEARVEPRLAAARRALRATDVTSARLEHPRRVDHRLRRHQVAQAGREKDDGEAPGGHLPVGGSGLGHLAGEYYAAPWLMKRPRMSYFCGFALRR